MAIHLSLTAGYGPFEDGWTQARIRELLAVMAAGPAPAAPAPVTYR